MLLAGLLTGLGTYLLFSLIVALTRIPLRPEREPLDIIWYHVSSIGIYSAYYPHLILLPLLAGAIMNLLIVNNQPSITARMNETSSRFLYSVLAALLTLGLVLIVWPVHLIQNALQVSVVPRHVIEFLVRLPYQNAYLSNYALLYLGVLLLIGTLTYYWLLPSVPNESTA
jgi:hypothetical protein